MEEEAEYLGKESCEACGSSDAKAVYTDHTFCFRCRAHTQLTVSKPKVKRMTDTSLILDGQYQAIPKRGLSEETCRKFGYSVVEIRGQTAHCATYRNTNGEAIAQKLRFPNKEFVVLGDSKNMGLYGQHLWRDKGRKVIITEGEIDALSMSQVQGNKWPVVSIPNGVSSAKKTVQRALEWLEGFEEVIFLFDNDQPGIDAVKECAPLLTPGKAKIAKLPLKDANDMLVAGRTDELIQAVWDAKSFRPDGIINGKELWDVITTRVPGPSIGYPWAGLNNKLLGLRLAELVTITAGTGIGKSLLCKELAVHLLRNGQSVGYVALEESVRRTSLGLMGVSASRTYHTEAGNVESPEFKAAFDETVGSGRCFLYDHFGSIDSPSLLSRIRYLVRGCGCNWIIFDHLSIMVSGSVENDERRMIDNAMTALRSMVQETGAGMILVNHLKRVDGKSHEEGGQISLSQLRGSGSIAQLSDVVIGLERDQQDAGDSNVTTVRVLKNRWTGETGIAGQLCYNKETGRLTEAPVAQF